MAKRKDKPNNLFKFLASFKLALFIFSLVIYLSRVIFFKFLITKINVIEVRPSPALVRYEDLKFLKNTDIFALDLKKTLNYLYIKYPQFSQIRIYKRFPDKVVIELSQRIPFVKIKDRANTFIVDRNFIIISKEQNFTNELVEVKGVKAKDAVSKKRLRLLRQEEIVRYLIQFFNKNKEYPRIASIDVLKLPDIRIGLKSGINVIIASHEFNNKIKFLLYLMPKIKQDSGKIDYIDLRFKEPVISYRGK